MNLDGNFFAEQNEHNKERDGGKPWVFELDAAFILGVKPAQLQAWRREGIGPPYVAGKGKYLYETRVLRTWRDRNLGVVDDG